MNDTYFTFANVLFVMHVHLIMNRSVAFNTEVSLSLHDQIAMFTKSPHLSRPSVRNIGKDRRM